MSGIRTEHELRGSFANVSGCAEAVALVAHALAAAGIESPRFEAQLLVAQALCVDRVAVVARTAPEPTAPLQAELYRLLAERMRRVPMAYLRGSQEFYGLDFVVNPATLIPRPETELLVDFAREVLGAASGAAPAVMIDVGAGSGCISISTLKHCTAARALAVDISAAALAVAKINSVRNGVSDRVRFAQANLLEGVRQSVQLIVSNPPYVATGQIDYLQPEVAQHEPRAALDGGEDGLVLIREILKSAPSLLCSGGWLAVECAQGQSAQVSELFSIAGLTSIRIDGDLAGIDRMVCGMRLLAE